jgi:hypothetical protein
MLYNTFMSHALMQVLQMISRLLVMRLLRLVMVLLLLRQLLLMVLLTLQILMVLLLVDGAAAKNGNGIMKLGAMITQLAA